MDGWGAIGTIVGVVLGALAGAYVKIYGKTKLENRADINQQYEHNKKERADVDELMRGIVADLRARDDRQQAQIDTLHREHVECEKGRAALAHEMQAVKVKVKEIDQRSFGST